MRAYNAYRGDKVVVRGEQGAEVIGCHTCSDRIKVRYEDGSEEWVAASLVEPVKK